MQPFHQADDKAQRGAQIVGDGIAEGFQFLVGGLQLGRAFGDALFQVGVEPADFVIRALALGDVADVALNDFEVAGLIDMADKLHGQVAAIPGFQRQVFIADKPILAQALQHRLIGLDALEQIKFPDGFAGHFPPGKTQ